MSEKKFNTLPFVLIVIAVFGLAFFLFFNKSKSPTSPKEDLVHIGVVPAAFNEGAVTTEKDLEKYKNPSRKFSLKYPVGISVTEYNEGKGAYTITFEEKQGDKSFQIFIVPYKEKTISKERFAMDVSSGVMKEKTNIIIDGVEATMFWSENDLMGETREVWFIHGGYLYEVTTYKEYDSWLGSIMQNWRFLQ